MVNGEFLGRLFGTVFGETGWIFEPDDAYIIASAVDRALSTLTPPVKR